MDITLIFSKWEGCFCGHYLKLYEKCKPVTLHWQTGAREAAGLRPGLAILVARLMYCLVMLYSKY